MTFGKAIILKPTELRRIFDPMDIPFETSDLVSSDCQESVLGQNRAKQALKFGFSIHEMDYHLFVAGSHATGKTHLVRNFVEQLASQQPQPSDWVYVHNFRQPDQAKALRLLPGGGQVLAKEMFDLVLAFKTKIPELFESEEYAIRKEKFLSEFKRKRADIFSELDQYSKKLGYALRFESTGIVIAPIGEDGEPIAEVVIRAMSEEAKKDLRERSDEVQNKVTEALRLVAIMEKEFAKIMTNLDRDMVLARIGNLFDELFNKYVQQQEVIQYLEQVREDVITNFERFRKKEVQQLPFVMSNEEAFLKQYEVNVFVDNSKTVGAPVLFERHPTHPNLFGRIERQIQFGAFITDFTLLRPGALHKANGGYLILSVSELLRMWLPWETLKRSLKDCKIFMGDTLEELGYIVTRSLSPEPIPLDIKIILVGDTKLYQLLYKYEPDFSKIFKVRVQMDDHIEWAKDEIDRLIFYLCNIARIKKMLPLHRNAIARLIELAAELAEDRERLTLKLGLLEDILKESNFIACESGQKILEVQNIEEAISQRRYRSSFLEEQLREIILRGFINIETTGNKVGQINGLAVIEQGDYVFGYPGRITASLSFGKEGVIDIEREAKLSGSIHTKGVLILSGFLRDRFGVDGPLALTISLVFEQNYGMVDGDSASLAELLAIISRLSCVPLRQDLAVTGSISQHGEVQAIGKVAAKIEGFFRLCQEKGFTGTQGVVIPLVNVKNLMLHHDIVKEVKNKRFYIYAVEQADQALELFTGFKVGTRGINGYFPKGTINWLAHKEIIRLRNLTKKIKNL